MERHKSGQNVHAAMEMNGKPVVSAHHISSIAHHFFDEADASDGSLSAETSRRFMTFSAGSSPVAAVAAAGLSMGSRGDYHKGRIVLKENEGITWSASSFLQQSSIQLLGPVGTGENEGLGDDSGSAWLVQPGFDVGASHNELSGTVKWFNGGCADDNALYGMETIARSQAWGGNISGACDGLVWCLLEKEAISLIAAYKMGRLISFLQPSQVEILIFPDSWGKTGKPIWQRKLIKIRGDTPSEQASLVNRCRELAAAVGDCQVSLMPESLAQGKGQHGSSGGILQMIASRMIAADMA